MGLFLFILLVILIAVFGFWETLSAIVGAAVLIVLAVLLGTGVLVLGVWMLLNRGKGG
jgi:hypothetical protein